MKAAIIIIGNEILLGQVHDSNSGFIAGQLAAIGIETQRITTVGDDREAIQSALDQARGVDLTIMTGGLGPTSDDITKHVLTGYFGTRLVHDPQVQADVESFLTARGIEVGANNSGQAMVPENCEVIRNSVGTAPIMWFEVEGQILVSLPGVPMEMQTAMTTSIIPRLHGVRDSPAIVSRTVMTTGVAESDLAQRLQAFERSLAPEMRLAYLPAPGGVRLRIDVLDRPLKNAQLLLANALAKLHPILGDAIFAERDLPLPQVVAELAIDLATTIACAGLGNAGAVLARLITTAAGSSNYFRGAVVAATERDNGDALQDMLELAKHDQLISPAVALAMARGVRRLSGADYGLAIVGRSGAESGLDAVALGTYWMGVSGPGGEVSQEARFGGNPERINTRAAIAGLNLLRLQLLSARQAAN